MEPTGSLPSASVSDPDVVVGDDGLARPVWASVDPLLRDYYDTEWGMPVRDERGMFERLSLEAFQSGLSWATILRKRPAFRAAFDDFDPEVVAALRRRRRRAADGATPGSSATAPRSLATITNARATVALRDDAEGGLAASCGPSGRPTARDRARYAEVPTRSPESLALSKALKRQGVRVRRADDDVRADGGRRHRRHPPARQPPAREQRGLARLSTRLAVRSPWAQTTGPCGVRRGGWFRPQGPR